MAAYRSDMSLCLLSFPSMMALIFDSKEGVSAEAASLAGHLGLGID
jgi:hypothetical protein